MRSIAQSISQSITQKLQLWILVSGILVGAVGWASEKPELLVFAPSNAESAAAANTPDFSRLDRALIRRYLEPRYSRIEWIGPTAVESAEKSFARLLERISARSALGREVDLIVLAAPNASALRAALEARAQAKGRGLGLRWVYQAGAGGDELLAAWLGVDVESVVIQSGSTQRSGLFTPRFLRRWGEGASVLTAVREATEFAQKAERTLAPFLVQGTAAGGADLNSPAVMTAGADIDVNGNRGSVPMTRDWENAFWQSRAAQDEGSSEDPSEWVCDPLRRGQLDYAFSDFLRGLFPQVELSVDQMSSSEAFLGRAGDTAWELWQDRFGQKRDGAISTTQTPDEMWVEGDGLRYFLGPLANWLGREGNLLLDAIQGAHITKSAQSLRVALYFNSALKLRFMEERDAERGQLYGVDLPKVLRFHLSLKDGIVWAWDLDAGGWSGMKLKVRLPAIPDSVYLRTSRLDLYDGRIEVEAGVIGNAVSLVGRGQLYTRKFEGIDLWDTIGSNLRTWYWPYLYLTL